MNSEPPGQNDPRPCILASPPLPPRSTHVEPFEAERVNPVGPTSFHALSGAPGFLERRLPAAERFGQARVTARILKRSPSSDPRAAVAFAPSEGIRILYILEGWAVFDIEGLAPTRLEKGTLACLPPENRQRFLEGSPDFEMMEFGLPLLTTSLTATWPAGGPSHATPAMIDRETTDSFKSIPNFLPGVERDFPIVRQMTGGAAKALVLRANPPHPWDGTPWHIHHNNFYCSLMTSGTHSQEYEGFGNYDFKKGDFFVQQGDIRHREIMSSLDFEILTFDLPGMSPATVLLYDEAEGAYKAMMFTTSLEIGGALA